MINFGQGIKLQWTVLNKSFTGYEIGLKSAIITVGDSTVDEL